MPHFKAIKAEYQVAHENGKITHTKEFIYPSDSAFFAEDGKVMKALSPNWIQFVNPLNR